MRYNFKRVTMYGRILRSLGLALFYHIFIQTNSVIDNKQKLMRVDGNNSSFNNKRQGNFRDNLLQGKDTYDRSFIWNMISFVEDMSVEGYY